MTAVSLLQPENIARLLAIIAERHELRARLDALDQEENDILMGTGHAQQIDFSMFKDETSRLLMEFWKAQNRMLSQEDIWQDVMFLNPDDEINNGAIRQVIDRARKAIETCPDFRYEIKNIRGKGYQLVNREVLQRVTNTPKNTGKTPQKRRNTL
jgi:DNA-binding response OmpR family regulator